LLNILQGAKLFRNRRWLEIERWLRCRPVLNWVCLDFPSHFFFVF